MIIAQTAPQQKTVVRYDRSAKTWLAVNGTTTEHPNRQNALLRALQNDHPQLYERVIRIAAMHNQDDQLMSRLLKAAALVAKGQVNGDTVNSQSTDQVYNVTYEFCTWSCNCPDFERGGIDTDYAPKTCKHILAHILAYLAATDDTETDIDQFMTRDTALPAYVDNTDYLENWLG